MPLNERRPARAKRLIQHYVNAKKAWERRLQCQKAALCQNLRHANQVLGCVDSPASLSSLSDMSTSSDSGENMGNWEDILSLDWWNGLQDTSQTSLHEGVRFNDTELPELASLGSINFSSGLEDESSSSGDDFD